MASLIARFLDGATTVAEEERMARYFRETADVPEEWRVYRDMFAYMDDGMPLGAVPDFDGVSEAAPVRRRRAVLWWGAGAVAAAAAAALLLVVQPRSAAVLPGPTGERATLARTQVPDTIAADTAQSSPTLLPPLRKPAADRRQRRVRYDVAPPKTYYASAAPSMASSVAVVRGDSVSADMSERLVAQHKAVEEEQRQIQEVIQETRRLVDAARGQLVASESYDDGEY